MAEITNYQLATIAVALLGGDTEYVDREDIAIKLDEIAPGRFNWRNYPERIDLVIVVTSLRDAKKPKNGKLLVGNNTQGWMLSPTGLRWVKSFDSTGFVGNEQMARARKDSINANQEAERIRLRNTRAYELFVTHEHDEITLSDFYKFARVNEYFQTKARQRRYTIVENAVADDDVLYDLWELLKKEFPGEMT
jgi:hypothetical protein